MVKKLIVGGVLLYVVVLTILIVALTAATPGPENQAFIGVNIGQYGQPGGIAGFSGKRMNCINQAGVPLESTCTIEIAGKLLEVSGRRNPENPDGNIDGTCTANYDGRSWPCQIRWGDTVTLAWYAMIDDPLGLTPSQMDELRMRYPIENAGDTFFTILIFVVSTLNVLLYDMVAWQWLPTKLRKSISVWAALVGASLGIWLISVFFWGWLTFNLWD